MGDNMCESVLRDEGEQKQKIIMPHLGILVTTYCNLNCRDCADLIPQRERQHYEIEDIKKDLKKLLDVVDYIDEVLVIGGETFLYPHLEEALDFCRAQDKIGRLIVTTNAVLQPAENILDCLKRNDVLVRVSGYPESVAPNRKNVVSTYLNKGIAIEDLENMQWLSMGDANERNRSKEELERVFRTCSMKDCVTINCEGKIFCCSRAMAAYETDIYPDLEKNEYVDIREGDNLRQKLISFYGLHYISTCNYCDGISCATKSIVPTAAQILNKSIFLEFLSIYNTWNETREGDAEERIRLKSLLNYLSKDYNYCVSEGEVQIPFYAKLKPSGNNVLNKITVSFSPDTQADIILDTDEILCAMNEKYPIDGMVYNRLFIESKLAKVRTAECIVSGLSYTQYGILENNMPFPTANLSITGQDIPYSILMARKALEINKDIKWIVMPIAYYHGFYDMSADDAQLHQEVVSRIDIPILGDRRNYNGPEWKKYQEGSILEIYNIICDLKQLREERDRQIKAALIDKEYFNEWNPPNLYGGLKFDFRALNEDEKAESAKITADLNERICTESGYQEVHKYLKEFLEDMYSLGKKLLFFVPPMTKWLFNAYHQRLKDAYYEKIEPSLAQYDNVRFIDIACDERFDEKDFCDFEHLNSSGAVKLTQILGDYMK